MTHTGRVSSRILLGVMLIALVGVGCSMPRISATPRAAWLDIDGELGASTNRGTLSATTDADDLGLDDPRFAFMPKVAFDWDPIHVGLQATTASFSGDGEATARLALGSVEIEQGANVETDLGFDSVVGTFVVDVLPIPTVDVGIGLGLGLVSYDIEVDAKDFDATVRLEDTLPLGYLTARVATEIGPVSLLGTVSGISVELESDEVDLFEFDVSAGLRVFGEESLLEGRIVGGYRYTDLDYTYKSGRGRLEADLTLKGPYLGFELSF